jgi:outer membrane protein assembly factor BamB
MKFAIQLIAFACTLSLFLVSCDPFGQPDPPPPLTPSDLCDPLKKTKMLWASPFTKDTLPMYSADAMAISDDLVFHYCIENAVDPLQARSNTDGTLIWSTKISGLVNGGLTSTEVSGEHLIIESWGKLWIFNKNNGTLLWSNTSFPTNESGRPRMVIIDGHIYYKTVGQIGDIEDYSKIYRTPIDRFEPETIFQADVVTSPGRDSGYILGIECGALWEKPNGDDVLVFQTRGFRLGTNKNRTDLYAYNMTTKTVEWRIDSIDAKSTVHNPIIEGNDLYYQGEATLFKIGMETGNIIWSHYFSRIDEHMYTSRQLVGSKYVYIQPGARYAFAVDKATGNVAWQTEKIGCCGASKGQMQQIGDNLYYISAPNLVSISATQNKINWICESPMDPFVKDNQFEQYSWSLKVPNKNIIITSDTHFVMAFEVTE